MVPQSPGTAHTWKHIKSQELSDPMSTSLPSSRVHACTFTSFTGAPGRLETRGAAGDGSSSQTHPLTPSPGTRILASFSQTK